MPKKSRRKNKRKKSRTRKKRGAVKFGKNKTTSDIVKEGRKILQTTPQRKKRQYREQQIKLTGEKEFALFKNNIEFAFLYLCKTILLLFDFPVFTLTSL